MNVCGQQASDVKHRSPNSRQKGSALSPRTADAVALASALVIGRRTSVWTDDDVQVEITARNFASGQSDQRQLMINFVALNPYF